MAKEKAKKEIKAIKKFEITKPNGNIIYRENLGKYAKVYESKGYKVKEL